MALLKLAVRNLLRNRRRTVITLVALVAGVGAMVAIKGFILGQRRQIDGHLGTLADRWQGLRHRGEADLREQLLGDRVGPQFRAQHLEIVDLSVEDDVDVPLVVVHGLGTGIAGVDDRQPGMRQAGTCIRPYARTVGPPMVQPARHFAQARIDFDTTLLVRFTSQKTRNAAHGCPFNTQPSRQYRPDPKMPKLIRRGVVQKTLRHKQTTSHGP